MFSEIVFSLLITSAAMVDAIAPSLLAQSFLKDARVSFVMGVGYFFNALSI